MDWTLFWTVVIGGLPVVSSYFWYAYLSDAGFLLRDIQGPFKGSALNMWLLSAFITVFCYVYISVMFIGGEDVGYSALTDMQQHVLYPTYALFLSSASNYTYLTTLDLLNGKKSFYLAINLWVVAISSIGFMWTVVLGDDPPTFLLLCATYLVFHHLVLDAIYWYRGFNVTYNRI